MHTKSTLLLVVLAAAAGLWLWKGDAWGPSLGLPSRAAAAPSPSIDLLTNRFTKDKVTRIEIVGEPGAELTLEKTTGEVGWKLPGNWPLRKAEVAELVDLLTSLHTRFQPIPLGENADLAAYGLAKDQKPLVVHLTAADTVYTLTFGEPTPVAGESPFIRPAYLRINDNPEVVRLGPDMMPILRRPSDSYRRRQLFPEAERVKVAQSVPPNPFGPSASGASTVAILTEKVSEIAVQGTKPLDAFTLKRTGSFPQPVEEKGSEPAVQPQDIADAWELEAPRRDRVNADKLEKILTTIPDLWVDEFATDAKKAEFEKPEHTLTVTLADGSKVTLLIGAVAKRVSREVPGPAAPPMSGLPPIPSTRTVVDEYRFAKLADNPQAFILKADKFADLFVKPDALRDLQLVHIKTENVIEVSILFPNQPKTRLVRSDNKWSLETPSGPVPAEGSLVADLLDKFAELRGTGGDAMGDPESGAIITLIVKGKGSDAAPRSVVLNLGRAKLGPWPAIASTFSALVAIGVGANMDEPRIPARVEGWSRVASVDASILKAAAPEGGFRSRTLSDFSGADKLVLDRGGKSIAYTRTGGVWKQTAPKESTVDSAAIEEFAFSLGRLRADRFAAEHASPAEQKKFGLDPPQAKWTVFSGGKELLALSVGSKEADGKVYAKLSGSDAVAVLSTEESKKVLAEYKGKKVWDFDEAKVESIEVERGGKKFKLVRKDAGWIDPAAPKDAIDTRAASELLTTLGGLKAERWLGADFKNAGTEKPSATITLTERGGAKRVLDLGSPVEGPPTKKLYARVNAPGAEPFVLGEIDVERLTRDRSAYLAKK